MQWHRLCSARALVLKPEILLFDEPTASLDPEAAAVIENLIVALKAHSTIIMVSHYRSQVQRIADSVMALNHRHLIRLEDFSTTAFHA